jgi:hypothetical protein
MNNDLLNINWEIDLKLECKAIDLQLTSLDLLSMHKQRIDDKMIFSELDEKINSYI